MEYEVTVRTFGIVETRIRVQADDRAQAEEVAIDEARGRADTHVWSVVAPISEKTLLDSVVTEELDAAPISIVERKRNVANAG